MILSCNSLYASYDRDVLENVSFSVESGDFICIVGENGSGKTTLLKTILGLHPVKSGSIYKKEGLCLGYVPQKINLKRDFPATAEEIVRTGLKTRRPFLSRADKELVRENMKQFGIDSKRTSRFSALSGGQQQRVLLARALTASRSLLILDEPAGGLDPLAISDLYALLKDLNRKENLTILMVSHDIASAVGCASKILHIDKTVKFFGAPMHYVCSECGKRFLGGDSVE